MRKLLKKEFLLAMHPTTPMMVLLSAMVLIPSYPYAVIFFYVSMALFFTCLLGRENNDIVYSMNLPVRKSDIVRARFLFAVIVEFAQLVVMIPLTLLSGNLNPTGNQAGMNANVALFGYAFITYGLFNLVFFTGYYKDVSKVGVAFVKSSVVIFLCVTADVVTSYAVPFVRDQLDTPDPAHMDAKLIILAAGALVFAACTYIAYRKSVRSFEKLDVN